MGATAPERHREVAVTPLQSDLTRATPRCRSRRNNETRPERPVAATPPVAPESWSDLTTATRRSRSRLHPPERPVAATSPGRSRRNDPGATSPSDYWREIKGD
ncbi:hypothetical protein F2Q68_00036031 [Brassica cretica]|uniref:Uncharacterized protein n=1 Tax=Brassica cretica TaxID=69181 RepID=A0A8S9HAR4_BRACR|nr:hypothetical protein F2Q68_00036031 [Brassica cretica]